MCDYDFDRELHRRYDQFGIAFRYIPFVFDRKYVSDNIGEEETAYWTSDCPVFISAQTGRGKNFFLKDVIVRTVHNGNLRNGEKRKILILSNRIALTRQSKKDWNKALVDITGDDNAEKFELYTDKGVDSQLLDLGIVTICSYQQLLGQIKRLRKENFAYVIADECHFFTGDAMFNPFTHQILETMVRYFKHSVRVYMSATLEESFVPIMTAEYPDLAAYYYQEEPLCTYYYFERNFDYISDICAYDSLEQLKEKVKNNPAERWLIFVSSKNEGRKFAELCSAEGITNIFLTRESKDAADDSEEHKVYRQIVEEEKFPVQVLIATSVLDNGVNLKDSAIKHVVIDMLDQTEFIQMLGRVRISGNATVNLYVRQYSDETIEKFFIDDVKKLIGRLKTDAVPKVLRQGYFYNLLENQNEVKRMFFFTGDEKFFDYNPCAVYKLVSRIGTFRRILKGNSEYFVDPEKLGKFRAARADLYSEYLNNVADHCPYREFLREPVCQILESAYENKNREKKLAEYRISGDKIFETPESFMDFSHAGELTFSAYLFRILLDGQNDGSEDKIFLLSLANSEVPALTEQSHWVEKDKLTVSDFSFIEPPAPLPAESEILEIIDSLSIAHEDYMRFSDNEKIKKSGAKECISFKSGELLEEKGCKKSLVKISKGLLSEELDASNVGKYNKIIDWVRRTKKFFFEKPEELVGIPFTDDVDEYQLKIVRGTQRGYQSEYFIFVKSSRQM